MKRSGGNVYCEMESASEPHKVRKSSRPRLNRLKDDGGRCKSVHLPNSSRHGTCQNLSRCGKESLSEVSHALRRVMLRNRHRANPNLNARFILKDQSVAHITIVDIR